jgi:DnaK suppressor protein
MAISNEALQKLKSILIEKKEEILKDLNSITTNDRHEKDEHRAMFPEYGDKIDENAQEISEYSTNLATEKILESSLRDIEAALKRVEDGTYGICKYCGKDIGEKRLEARPVASACMECKTKLQKAF